MEYQLEYQRIGYFVVAASERAELTAQFAHEQTLQGDWLDSQVFSNQIFRYAQNRALSQWRYAHPLAQEAKARVTSYLWRKCENFPDTMLYMPETCPVVARAVDDLAARRGGQDALIRQITKLTLGQVPLSMICDIYVAFRAGLATAIELDAALVSIGYRPGVEGLRAAERAREAAWRAEECPPWTPEQREAAEREMRALEEPIIETEPHPFAVADTQPRLYAVPEPYISEVMAMFAESEAIYAAGEGDAWERSFSVSEKAQLIAFEEWRRWLRLERRGQTSAWEYLELTLGEFRPGRRLGQHLAVGPDRVPALFATLCDWQASVGGRDAAVAYLAEKSHGHHLGLTGLTYDAVFALYQYAAENGCGLVNSPLYDMA